MGEATFTINISVEEYTRLKDIETRFEIMKNQMMDDEYCPKHIQIILGIEQEYAEKKEQQMKRFRELNADMFPAK
jgi:hypothetical protein